MTRRPTIDQRSNRIKTNEYKSKNIISLWWIGFIPPKYFHHFSWFSLFVCILLNYSQLCVVHRGSMDCINFPLIFTARRYAGAVYAVDSRFVCLSVTNRNFAKTAKRKITQMTSYDSAGNLDVLQPKVLEKFQWGGGDILHIRQRQLWWPWVTFEVIHLLQAFSTGFFLQLFRDLSTYLFTYLLT